MIDVAKALCHSDEGSDSGGILILPDGEYQDSSQPAGAAQNDNLGWTQP